MSQRVQITDAWQDEGANVAAVSRGGFPNDTNTGHLNEPGYPGFLTPFSGTIESETTYSYQDFAGAAVGTADTPVSDVTFIGCRFRRTSPEDALVLLYGDAITYSYCTFQPNVAAPPSGYLESYQYGVQGEGAYNTHIGALTMDHCDMWGFGNGIVINGSTEAKPHVFTNNWIHDASDPNDPLNTYHTDGIGSLSNHGSGSFVLIDHNTVESAGNTNGIAFQETGAAAGFDDGIYTDFTITNNLIGGWGYAVALWATPAGSGARTTFTDNLFSTRLPVVFGPLYPQEFWLADGSVWARNRWLVPPGAAWGTPSNNGKFWLPNALDKNDFDGSDDPFVSATDYTP